MLYCNCNPNYLKWAKWTHSRLGLGFREKGVTGRMALVAGTESATSTCL